MHGHATTTDHRDRSGGASGRARWPGHASRRCVAVATLLALVPVAACATRPPVAGEAAAPTFERASGSGLTAEEPTANLADLVTPSEGDAAWTIVGSVYDPGEGAASATAWTSEDGRRWDRRTVGSARHGRDATIAAAARRGDGLVAVGRVGTGEGADAALWSRRDGEWTSSVPDVMAGDHEQWAFDVAVGPGGIVVAGAEEVWGDVRPRLWFSTDGDEWESVDGGAGGPLDATGSEAVHAVAPVGDGFVAVGGRTLEGEEDGLAWSSPDGRRWEPLDAPALGGPRRQDVLTVTAAGRGVVAGGTADADGDGQGEPVTWASGDGRTWSGPTGPLPMTDSRSGASDLAVRSLSSAGGSSLVASGGADWRPRLWRSADGGRSWSELPNPVHGKLFQDGVTLRAAASRGDLTLAIGAEPSVLMLAGARWEDVTSDEFPSGGAQPFATTVTATDDLTLAAGGRFTTGHGEKRDAVAGQLWVEDGDRWRAVGSKNLASGQVLDTTAFAGGYVAVGVEDFGLASGRDVVVGDDLPDGLVWLSPNGADWVRVASQNARVNAEVLEFLEDPSAEMAPVIAQLEAEAPSPSVPPAGGPGTQSLEAVAAIGKGFIATGSTYDHGDANPIVLVSPDGKRFAAEGPPHGGPGDQRYEDVCVGPGDVAVTVGVAGATGATDAIVAARTRRGWVAGRGNGFTARGDQGATACAAGKDGFIAVGSDDRSGNRDARLWTSEDGIEWSELGSSLLGGNGDQRATAVAAVPGGGWLVAGTDGARGDGDIALWRVDGKGRVTRRDTGEDALGGPGEQTVTAVAIDDDGRVTLAGDDRGRAGLWRADSLDR